MNIKAYLQQAIAGIQSDKDRELVALKEKITREKILPFNQDIDSARDTAIKEKQAMLEANISALQQQFAKEKQEIIAAAEQKKSDNAASVLASETYAVSAVYENSIAELNKQIEQLDV